MGRIRTIKHVANGVEILDTASGGTGLIFYGLGNFLHLSTQNMGRHDLCHDFGLLGRVVVSKDKDGAWSVVSMRIVPLTDMHIATKPLPPDLAETRIHVINHLSKPLTDAEAGAQGLSFTPQPDGSGLWCNPTLSSVGCSAARETVPVSRSLASKIDRACKRVLTR